MKNLIKAQGLRAQMVTLGNMPNLSPAMQQWLQAGVVLIDHVFEDKKEVYKGDRAMKYELGHILDRANDLMEKIVELAALEKEQMDQKIKEDEDEDDLSFYLRLHNK